MTSDLQALQFAGQLIDLARGEETGSGNPLAAAKYYTTAMETIISTAYKHAASMDDLPTRRAFLCQVRNRVEVYYERAELLLQVAAETGLLDKPGQGGGLQAALPGPALPAQAPSLFGSETSHAGSNAGGGGVGGKGHAMGASAVMGIPLPPQPATGGAGAEDRASPSPNYYIKPESGGQRGGTAAPPPPPDVDLDDLMRQLGAPKDP